MLEGVTKYPFEASSLMGLGFGASLLFTAWYGTQKGIPDFGVRMPKGLMMSKGQRWKIKHIENSLRANLSRFSFKTSQGSFLPFKAYSRWKVNHDKYRKEFERQRDRFLSEYDALPNLVRKEADGWISEVFRLISNSEKDEKPTTPFYENMVSIIVSSAPDKKELSRLFNCKISLLPYSGLGTSLFIGTKWPAFREWDQVAKDGIEFSAGNADDVSSEFLNEIACQYSQKCREMFQSAFDVLSKKSASHIVLSSLSESLDDAEALNFFEDFTLSNLLLEAKGKTRRETQAELEARLIDLLSYVNSTYKR